MIRGAQITDHGGRRIRLPAGGFVRSLCAALIALFLCISPDGAADEIRINAGFEPDLVPLGQRTHYVITIEGHDGPLGGIPPEVRGLAISSVPVRSMESETRIIQGRTHSSHRVRYSFRTSPSTTGEFTVPAWQASVAGRSLRIPAAHLEVVEPGEEMRNAFLLVLEPEVRDLYIGESRPVELILLLREDVRAQPRSRPVKTGDAFLDPDFRREPIVERVRYRNNVYHAVRWPFVLTPVKTGTETLSFSIDLAVLGRDDRRMDRMLDPFDRTFGRSIFSRQTVEERTVRTGIPPIEVRELPETGRPGSFTGAIGSFTVDHRISERTTQVRDPISLTVQIAGEGNFPRIEAPALESDDDWRIYPARTEFTADDEHSHKGNLHIEYIISPRHTGVAHTPEIAFSYFDPVAERYEERNLAPLPVSVRAGPESAAEGTALRHAGIDVEGVTSLHGVQLLPEPWLTTGGPPIHRTRSFYVAQAAPLLLLAGLAAWRRRHNRLREDSLFARRTSANRAVREHLRKARGAIGRSDVPAFFVHARRAVQHCLMRHIPEQQRPESLTWPDVSNYLRDREAGDSLCNEAGMIFETADALEFGGASVAADQLPAWERRLLALIRELEKTAPRPPRKPSPQS